MKLLTRTTHTPAEGGEVQTSYRVENATAAILGAIGTLAIALGTFIGNLSEHKNDNALFKLKDKYIQVLLLERALGDPSTTERANSLQLLLASEIIEDPNGRLKEMVDSGKVPKWVIRESSPIDVMLGSSTSESRTGGTQLERTQPEGTRPGVAQPGATRPR